MEKYEDIDQRIINIIKMVIYCPNIDQYYENKLNVCYEIIKSQYKRNKNEFQLPEPFSGQIDKAKILIISSNPAIDNESIYPNYQWDEYKIFEYFYKRFDKYIKDGTKNYLKKGGFSNAVRFWASIKARVNEIYQMKNLKATPGIDYCLTEIVHCKSIMAEGVQNATNYCHKYFRSIVELSPASIIIVVGKSAQKLFCEEYNLAKFLNEKIIGPVLIENKKRMILFILAPAAIGHKKLEKWLNSSELCILNNWVKENL
jgi:uracil-DNA glycosylase